MIVGLMGAPYSGKATLAGYLEQRHGYTKVNLADLPAELTIPKEEDHQLVAEANGPASQATTDAASSEETKDVSTSAAKT